MVTTYILPVIAFAAMGIIAGVLLSVFSKVFEVKTDERIEQINDVLPQANCGACGYAGCADYADAIITKDAPTNLCRPGGTKAADAISKITGTNSGEVVEQTAVLHCSGDCAATGIKYEFTGLKTCASVKRFYSGNSTCSFGCVGFGDCISVCELGAISIKDEIAHIDPDICMACGKCVSACPNKLISIKPKSFSTVVRCSSKDNGKVTKLNCKNGCIGCKMCEKNCPTGAITVTDFHASIDYTKCADCGVCAQKCPVKVIELI
ncbi:MAG: RnfABCDGE type electron transport complex subunit B [Oscillospiraceae bacterium]|nr:RnfABCDGE type electron transport complex subunit B [Oscillospiraceae bacterium]